MHIFCKGAIKLEIYLTFQMKVVVLLLACFIPPIVGNGANAVTKFILFVQSNYKIGQLIMKKSLFSTRLSKKMRSGA